MLISYTYYNPTHLFWSNLVIYLAKTNNRGLG